MHIYCKTLDEFKAMIYWCVTQGLTFRAHVEKLEINLLGGY